MERALRELLREGQFDSEAGNSRRMSAIRAGGNKSTERRLRAWLARSGVRGWRLRPVGLPGKPDFLFPAERVVVFVDGCFWHGCPQHGTSAKSNAAFWAAKITANQARDLDTSRRLREAGWTVVRVWEHDTATAAADQVQLVLQRMAEAAEQ
jgi:DNA mismatch endonuclease, patch repair protein